MTKDASSCPPASVRCSGVWLGSPVFLMKQHVLARIRAGTISLFSGHEPIPGDLAGLQRVLGHASIKTTQIYFERADDLGAVERQQEMASNWR